jgi:hypothetical protein
MKVALQLAQAFGSLSLLMAAFAVFMLYADWDGKPQVSIATRSPTNIADALASAQDLASIKIVCRTLAESQDAYMTSLQSMRHILEQVFNGAVGFAFWWGLISGIAFLYLHYFLRRISRAGGEHGL